MPNQKPLQRKWEIWKIVITVVHLEFSKIKLFFTGYSPIFYLNLEQILLTKVTSSIQFHQWVTWVTAAVAAPFLNRTAEATWVLDRNSMNSPRIHNESWTNPTLSTGKKKNVYLAILRDLSGMVKWPFFEWLSDLQLGDEKVTLNHMVPIIHQGA